MDGSASKVLQGAVDVVRAAQLSAHNRVVDARMGLVKAQDEYEAALLDADALGLSASALAKSCGTSEAAIRLFIKRRKDRSD